MKVKIESESSPKNTKKRVSYYEFDTVTDVIGKGSYGEVYRATYVKSRGGVGVVALKKATSAKKEEGVPASTMREIMVFMETSKGARGNMEGGRSHVLGSDNVVKLHDVVMEDNIVYLATEYCEAGDLAGYLKKQLKNRISDPYQYRQWMRDLLRGVCYLHSKGFSHRDLKPHNIVLKAMPSGRAESDDTRDELTENAQSDRKNYILKITDFGLSCVEGIPVKKYQHVAVTLWYRSPDLLLGNTYYSHTADMWSAGCIIAEAASGNVLFRGDNDERQLKFIFTLLGVPTEHNFPSMKEYALYEKFSKSLNSLTGDLNAQRGSLPHSQDGLDEVKNSLARYFKRYGAEDVVGEDGIDLVSRLLLYEPRRRLTAQEALQHPFFTTLSRGIASTTATGWETSLPVISTGVIPGSKHSMDHSKNFEMAKGNCSDSLKTQRLPVPVSTLLQEQQQQQQQEQREEEITRGGTARALSTRVNGDAIPKALGVGALRGDVLHSHHPQINSAKAVAARDRKRN